MGGLCQVTTFSLIVIKVQNLQLSRNFSLFILNLLCYQTEIHCWDFAEVQEHSLGNRYRGDLGPAPFPAAENGGRMSAF